MIRKHLETPERYGGEPLYGNLLADYSQRERPFTVTVIGPERHDCTGRSGSATRYVLDACSTEKAWAAALAWHIGAEETPDCMVVADESYEGLPRTATGSATPTCAPSTTGGAASTTSPTRPPSWSSGSTTRPPHTWTTTARRGPRSGRPTRRPYPTAGSKAGAWCAGCPLSTAATERGQRS
ncbi:hypothetical protein ACR6C2_08110 [Streptomyces sp. INA 01156]